jgi:hypothetical protein
MAGVVGVERLGHPDQVAQAVDVRLRGALLLQVGGTDPFLPEGHDVHAFPGLRLWTIDPVG